jgi:YEATS domain-containing protein 4
MHPPSKLRKLGEYDHQRFMSKRTQPTNRWGEFEVQIKIAFAPESGEKPIAFYHHLKIHHWSLDPHVPDLSSEQELADARRHGPVQSWQYDEIVFNDPFQGFYDKLLKHPPTRLPRNRKRPIPFHTANPTRADLEASRGGVPEFTQEMEVQEAQRLDYAVDVVTIETERWQNRLTEREKELDMLRQQLGED